MRVFLDANILFSAAKADGAVRRLLRLAMGAGHVCWIDPHVEAEARRNLLAKSPESIAALESLLTGCRAGPLVPIAADLAGSLRTLPPDDRPVLAAAIRLRCGALITGDKRHFGIFYGKTVKGVVIHSPASFYSGVLRSRR